MIRPATVLVALSLPVATLAAPPGHRWCQRFGDASSQTVRGIAVDSFANVTLIGEYAGAIDFGAGAHVSQGGDDVFVAHFGPDGTLQWSKSVGDVAGTQRGTAVAADPAGAVYLTGFFQGTLDFGDGPLTAPGGADVFLAKLDASGTVEWSRSFGDNSGQSVNAIAIDPTGGVYIVGSFDGTVNFGGSTLTASGVEDVFIAKFDAQGTHLWSSRFGNVAAQIAFDVAVDPGNAVVMTGHYTGIVDFGGGSLISAGGLDVFVARLDANGAHLWSKRFGATSAQSGQAVACDVAGNVLVAGGFTNTINLGGATLASAGLEDAFLAKLDGTGAHVWSTRFGDVSGGQIVRSLTVDGEGDVTAAGSFLGTIDVGGGPLVSAGLEDVFVASFMPDGTHQWSARYGDTASQSAFAVQAEPSTDVYVAGGFDGAMDIDGTLLTSAGAADAFIAKLATSTLVDVPGLPAERLAINAFPNPFHPGTTIRFQVPSAQAVRVTIYDARGARVATLADAVFPAGEHTVRWSGTGTRGAALASGVYFARLETLRGRHTAKLVLVK